MIIDCGRCAERTDECNGCLVSTLYDTPDGIADLTGGELRAIGPEGAIAGVPTYGAPRNFSRTPRLA